jgi:hypothetical protein
MSYDNYTNKYKELKWLMVSFPESFPFLFLNSFKLKPNRKCLEWRHRNGQSKTKSITKLLSFCGFIFNFKTNRKEVEQRLKIELKMINTPHKSFQNKKNSTIQAKSSLKEENQSEISLSKETSNNINQKIKEMHRIRLFLKVIFDLKLTNSIWNYKKRCLKKINERFAK